MLISITSFKAFMMSFILSLTLGLYNEIVKIYFAKVVNELLVTEFTKVPIIFILP